MKYSPSQASPVHAGGRRPAPSHSAQHGNQYSATHSSPPPSNGTTGTAGSITGTAGGTKFIPDLATGAKSLNDSLEMLVRTASDTLGRLTGVGIECAVVLNRVKRISVTAGSSPQAARLAELEQELSDGPLTEALTGTGTVAMNHVATDFRWAQYRPHLQDAGFSSALGLRLRLHEGAEAALAFFAASAQVFPLPVIAEARNFADAAGRGLRLVLELQATSARASDLQLALESRTSIDIACGVIMAQNRCSYNDAITIIAKASSHRNVKLRKVAEGILENLPGGAPRTHFEH